MLAERNQKSYQWVQNNGQGYLQLPILDHSKAFHLFGTRLLTSEELQNRFKPIQLRQVHGNEIHPITKALQPSQVTTLSGDGLFTNLTNRFITIRTADCTPILLFDPVRYVTAAVHAGWRGSVLNIAGKAVQKMVSYFGSHPKNLIAGIGPAIHSCCLEVGRDVLEAVHENTPHGDLVFHRKEGQDGIEKWQLDLVRLNTLQLIDAGLPKSQIAAAGLCTSCLPNLFYSYRRDKKINGSMFSGIMLL